MRWILLAAAASVLVGCASTDNNSGGESEGLPLYNLKPKLESPDEFWRRQRQQEPDKGECGKVKGVVTCSV